MLRSWTVPSSLVPSPRCLPASRPRILRARTGAKATALTRPAELARLRQLSCLSQLSEDELFTTAWLKPSSTGLNMAVFLPNSEVCDLAPCLLVKADYDVCWEGNVFGVTLAKEPEVIGQTGRLRPEDVAKAKLYVQTNWQSLMKLWKLEDHSFKHLIKI